MDDKQIEVLKKLDKIIFRLGFIAGFAVCGIFALVLKLAL
jgi:uncharacterized membrane protein YciS (DUF1049 family)